MRSPLASPRKKFKSEYIWIYAFILPSVAIFALFYFWPIMQVLYTSFTKWSGVNTPEFIFLDNFIRLFKSAAFLSSLKNLLWWTIVAVVIHVGFGTLVAFVLQRKPFGWRFARLVFMIPNVISIAAWAIIFRFLFDDKMGFVNSFVRLFNPDFNVAWVGKSPYAFWVVTATWLFFAVVVTLIVQGDLMAIPAELHEAAYIDGASVFQITRKINLPLCRNAIGTAVICSVTSRIAMFEAITLTTGGGPGNDTMNIPVIMVRKILDSEGGYANSMAVIMILIGLLTLFAVNKLFRMNETIY